MFEMVEVTYICSERREGCSHMWKERLPKLLAKETVIYGATCPNCDRLKCIEEREIMKEVN